MQLKTYKIYFSYMLNIFGVFLNKFGHTVLPHVMVSINCIRINENTKHGIKNIVHATT